MEYWLVLHRENFMETYVIDIIKKNEWGGETREFIIRSGENIERVYFDIVSEYGSKSEYTIPEFQNLEFNVLRM